MRIVCEGSGYQKRSWIIALPLAVFLSLLLISAYLFQRNILYLFNNLSGVASYLATQSLGRNVRISTVQLDLFKGEVSFKDIEVEGTNPILPPFVSMDKLSLKLDLASLIREKDLLKSIKKIYIGKLRFFLFCDEKGRFNFPRPKPVKPPRRFLPSFPIEIGTIEGSIQDSFISRQEWKIGGKGRIILHQQTTAFHIQGGINGSPFIIRGESKKGNNRLALAVKSLKFSLPSARGVITASIVLQLRGGKVLWGAQASLRDAKITHNKLPFKILNCSFDFIGNQRVCRISDLEVSIDKGISLKEGEGVFLPYKPYTLLASGRAEGKASSFLSLLRASQKKKFAQLIGDFPLRAEVEIVGNLNKPIVDIDISVAKTYFRGLAIDNNRIKVRYINEELEIREGESHLMGGEIRYRGVVNLKEKSYVWGGEVENLEFDKLPDNLRQTLIRVNGIEEFPKGMLEKATFWSKGKEGETPLLEIEAKLSRLKYVKVFQEKLNIKMVYENGVMRVDKLYGKDEKGILAFKGEVNFREQKVSGDVEGMDIDIGKVSRLFGLEGSKGFAYIRGKITGTFAEPTFEGGIEAFELGYGTNDVDYLLCMLEMKGDKFKVSKLNFTKGIGEGSAKGEVNISTGDLNLEGELHNLPLNQFLNEDIVRTGTIEGNFLVKGNFYSPYVEIEGKASDLIIKDNYVKTVSMALHWEQGVGLIERGEALLEEGEIDFWGELKENKLSLSVEGKRLSLASSPLLEEGVEGYVDLRGRLEGPLSSLGFQGEIEGDIIYKGQSGKLSAKISADKSRVEGENIILNLRDGRVFASLSYSLKEGNLAGYIRGENLPVDLAETLSRFPNQLEGKITTNLVLSGSLDKPSVRGMFRCEGLGNRYMEFTLLEGEYSLEGRILHLKNIKGEKGDFNLAGEAQFDLAGQDYSLLFYVQNLPLSMLNSFKPQLRVDGKGNVMIVGKGSFSSPLFSLAFDSSKAEFNGVELENIQFSTEWNGEAVNLKELVLRREGKEVKCSARLPVGIKDGLRKDKTLHIALNWEKQDIGWLKSFTPSLDELAGEVSGDVIVKGTYNQPDISGSISLEKCKVKPKGFEEGLKNTNARLVFQKNRGTFENFSFQVGEGRGEIKGNIYMGREGLKVETVASLTNITLKERNVSGYGESLQGSLNGFMNITGDLKKPLILGSLSLSNAKLDLSSYAPPKESREIAYKKLFNPNFLLTVGLGNNCWFISTGSRVLTEGRLSLIGSLNNPRLQGHFSSRSGIVLISNYIFRLREGAVDVVYLGNIFNLNVFARAETRLRDYKITAYISGPYDNLQLRFTSSPPLPQKTILAMFVPEGSLENPEQFFKNELASAFAAGLEAKVFAPLEFALAEATGLEEITLEYGLEGYPILRFKQSILPKTYLVYSRGLATPQERYTISLERNIGGDLYLTFTTDELKRKIWGIEGAMRF